MNIRYSPPIVMTTRDEQRLEALIYERRPGDPGHYPQEVLDFLASELDRATLVEPAKIRANVVTMNSRVLFRDEKNNSEREVTIVYPGIEAIGAGRISILSPVGSALIGLSEGRSITWRVTNGPWRTLKVLKVTYQPEAHARSESGRTTAEVG